MHIPVVKFFGVIPNSLLYFFFPLSVSLFPFFSFVERVCTVVICRISYIYKYMYMYMCAYTNKQPREERLHKWMLSSASASLSGLLLCSYARNHCTFS